MGYVFYSFLFLIGKHSNASLEALKTELEDFYKDDKRPVKLSLVSDLIILRINDWNLYIRYNNNPLVKQESMEMADSYAMDHPEKSAIAECSARFEMYADPDIGMEYFNDSLIVQQKIEDFKNVYSFDSNARIFTNIES